LRVHAGNGQPISLKKIVAELHSSARIIRSHVTVSLVGLVARPKTENSLAEKKKLPDENGKICLLGITGFCVNFWARSDHNQCKRNKPFAPFLYRRPGIWAFLGLSAFRRINNLHALNTPAQFDPD
jgi:hypothetical protein